MKKSTLQDWVMDVASEREKFPLSVHLDEITGVKIYPESIDEFYEIIKNDFLVFSKLNTNGERIGGFFLLE